MTEYRILRYFDFTVPGRRDFWDFRDIAAGWQSGDKLNVTKGGCKKQCTDTPVLIDLWRESGVAAELADGGDAILNIRSGVSSCLLLAIALLPQPAISGPAINQFEVKDLQSSPGDFEFQSQNAWSTGQPRRRSALTALGEIAFDDNTAIKQREALEIQLGVTDWFRVRFGVEFEQERLDDPGSFSEADRFAPIKFDEVAVEGVVIFVKPKDEGIGLGLLMEYGSPVGEMEAPAEFYAGPIIEARTGPWSFIANLMFVKYMGGKAEPGNDAYVRDEKWDFSYATQLEYEISRNFGVALEAYGTFDRLGNTGTPGETRVLFGDLNQHRAGPVVYYTFFPHEERALSHRTNGGEGAVALSGDADEGDKELSVAIGTGVLFGLNENTPDLTFKLSVEVEY